MTAEEFKMFWISNYPETVPISHYFKHDYSDRWFRIHSLPESKRYADNDGEWSILLHRQNQIITDLLGENSNFLLVTGEYTMEGYTELHPLAEVGSLAQMPFISLTKMDLNKLSPGEYDPGAFYHPMFSVQIWVPKKFDNILREIAYDNLRTFFISIEKELMIAPYDGGIDFILKNSETRDFYKRKYSSWISSRQDGF
ncbi:hypothetical protein [Chitinophaga sp. CF418]|uniref:DUF3885 domain-containing protein n=1 Tax=Chitinophaga sp. CF418 TaxID=1855287 RepID=UPI000914FAD3|nr:hypothetical protein [Chitinophaga sp. CF418]SHN09347.1 hypothetical protein SAMN05216311_105116 [Chitinophaga sp. CF418]